MSSNTSLTAAAIAPSFSSRMPGVSMTHAPEGNANICRVVVV